MIEQQQQPQPREPTPASTAAGAAAAEPAAASQPATTPPPPTPPSPPREYNPRWKGYSFVLLSSLINFSAVSNIQEDPAGPALSFGVVLFVYALAVLVTDRCGVDLYTKALDGRLEGYCLVVATLYAVTAVAYITQVGGVAYLALNAYFTAWLMLASCLYTLNRYSASRDILSFAEMTSVSATLKSWYIVFLASLVVTGTSINMFVVLDNERDDGGGKFPIVSPETLEDDDARGAALGIAFGLASTLLSMGMILVHYNLIEFCVEGGWTELSLIVLTILMWVVATAVLTEDEAIASTIAGSGCENVKAAKEVIPDEPDDSGNDDNNILSDALDYIRESIEDGLNCTLTVGQNVTFVYNCSDLVFEPTQPPTLPPVLQDVEPEKTTIPGSNLYLSLWTCLLGSINLASRWKAQQALTFAQAQQENARKFAQSTPSRRGRGDEIMEDDEEEEDDLDDLKTPIIIRKLLIYFCSVKCIFA